MKDTVFSRHEKTVCIILSMFFSVLTGICLYYRDILFTPILMCLSIGFSLMFNTDDKEHFVDYLFFSLVFSFGMIFAFYILTTITVFLPMMLFVFLLIMMIIIERGEGYES